LVVLDRAGRVTALPVEPSTFNLAPVLSPDGRSVAVPTRDAAEFGLWLIDLARGTRTRLVSEGDIFWPKWTPDGRRVAFLWRAAGTMSVAWVEVDATTAPERLVTVDASGSLAPLAWSPDGKRLVVDVLMPDGTRDISLLSLEDLSAGLRPLVNTKANEINGSLSRDGRWLAYVSNETGRYEVYLQPFPVASQRVLVSTAGGRNPVWHPHGRELFYVSEPDREGRRWVMSTSFAGQPRPAVGIPRPLFQTTIEPGTAGTTYDVFPSGDRFLALRPLPSTPPAPVTQINLVDHWFEELKTKVPTGGAK
jgi:Tol biopolymer transport system component